LPTCMITDLNTIAGLAIANETANNHLKAILLAMDSDAVDATVVDLQATITSQIDCTQCGNCCRSLMINVEKTDAERLAQHLQLSTQQVYERYIETSSQGSLAVMNTIPCHFLCDNKCTVYEARPAECREFPGLEAPNFTKRLFATFMHYGRCPIIFNVIEGLKTAVLK
jgi:uncharacterized protein